MKSDGYYVLGSGPSGVACAYALLQQDVPVTMLDSGLSLEPSREQRIVQLQKKASAEWSAGDLSFLRDGAVASTEGIPLKLAYGSDFPYRPVPGAVEFAVKNAGMGPSHAKGGLSNVWGSAVMPYREADIDSWPIDVASLSPHYRAVFDFMPLAARNDGLAEDFPLYADRLEPLPMSGQARRFLNSLESHREALASRGIQFGGARLAVDVHREGRSCAECGLCMYGCPNQLIYSSGFTVEALQRNPNFRYIPGFYAERLEEKGAEVTISGRALPSGETRSFQGSRVYAACGLLETTALLLRSLDLYNRPVTARDSQYFLLPLLRFAGTPAVRKEKLHTLAQLFLEINDAAISPRTIHLQTYTYNDLFEQPVHAAFGPLANLVPTEWLLSRLLLLQGYLHSDHSATLNMELRRTAGAVELQVSGQRNPETAGMVRALVGKLTRVAGMLGALPMLPLLRMGDPGRGYHSGGSFPMSTAPGHTGTDIYGRPGGLQRVHAVDSTIFPSIPATTITLTAMANAHRIGSEVEQYR